MLLTDVIDVNMANKDITLIKNYLLEKTSPYLIVLFGSAAKGGMRATSDVDVAFLSDQKFTAYDIFIIAQDLAGALNREVDLVDLQAASTVFQVQVIRNGKVIYCSDEYKRMLFEMLAFKKYAKLNEERKPILKK